MGSLMMLAEGTSAWESSSACSRLTRLSKAALLGFGSRAKIASISGAATADTDARATADRVGASEALGGVLAAPAGPEAATPLTAAGAAFAEAGPPLAAAGVAFAEAGPPLAAAGAAFAEAGTALAAPEPALPAAGTALAAPEPALAAGGTALAAARPALGEAAASLAAARAGEPFADDGGRAVALPGAGAAVQLTISNPATVTRPSVRTRSNLAAISPPTVLRSRRNPANVTPPRPRKPGGTPGLNASLRGDTRR